MTVSTYLEAFLSVYGWAVYRVFFLLLLATGLFLYPILRAMITIVTEYLSGDGYDGIGYIKQAIATVVLTMAVFFLAMVPVIKISFDKAEVSNICGVAGKSVTVMNEMNGKKGKRYFTRNEARVPLLPWLAMRLGQGINAVIYKQLPCVLHTTEANKAVLAVETGDKTLEQELDAFIQQCHRPAIELIKAIREGRYDQKTENNGKLTTWFNMEFDKYLKDYTSGKGKLNNDYFSNNKSKAQLEEELLYSVDSPFIQTYIYDLNSPLTTGPFQEELRGIPESMRAKSAVDGFSGKMNKEKTEENGLPLCGQWWSRGEGSTKALRTRLVEAMNKDILRRAATDMGIPACRKTGQNDLNGNPIIKDEAACLAAYMKETAGEDKDKFEYHMLLNYQGSKVHENDEGQLSFWQNAGIFIVAAGAIAFDIIAKLFGVDLSTGLLSTITSFYASIFMLKVMMNFLVPMVMMAIYMSWGIYMLIGELRGTTIMKGMSLIFSATIIYGLWSIADHIDDKLWDALYGGNNGNPISMIVLDATSGIFYIAIPAIIFYMINLAGGGDAGNAFSGGQKQSGDLSKGLGRAGTGNLGGFAKWAIFGQRDKKGELQSGGWGAKWAGKGWGSVKNFGSRGWTGMRTGIQRITNYFRRRE